MSVWYACEGMWHARKVSLAQRDLPFPWQELSVTFSDDDVDQSVCSDAYMNRHCPSCSSMAQWSTTVAEPAVRTTPYVYTTCKAGKEPVTCTVCYCVGLQWPPLWSSGQSSWLQNGEVLCFLWGTNWIYICYVEESRPPLWSSGQSSWLHNGDVLCFLWGTNWIYIFYVEESKPPLWPRGQSSWLQIQRPRFDSLFYQIFWEEVCLERGPVSLWIQLRGYLKEK
jgi:hypothetical protein